MTARPENSDKRLATSLATCTSFVSVAPYGDTVKRQPRTEASGPLAGHVRQGRLYRSQLAATGVLQVADWARDDLPDLLWPALTLSEAGTPAVRGFIRWQQEVQRELAGLATPQALASGLDGRLTSLDRLVDQVPTAARVVKERATEFGLLLPSVAAALASYPDDRPASWLVDLPTRAPEASEIRLLSRAVMEAVSDGHREAVIKCLSIWSAVNAGTFRSDATTIDLLKPYPNDPSTRVQADTVVRASWGAQRGAQVAREPHYFDASIKWAKIFWGINSMTTGCIRRRDAERPEDVDLESATDLGHKASHKANTESSPESCPDRNTQATALPDDGTQLRRLAVDLLTSYIEALETSPSRLYDPERQEVHSGLVNRAAREVITALGAPDLWCLEHGAHIGRMLVEVRIYLSWMATQEPTIYREFQEYGAGKAKLYARLLEEVRDTQVDPGVKEAIQEFDRLSHNHDILDHRVVDTRDSFAGGKSLRAMADECGLLDLYRHAYQISSGVTHSEWWSVETHCMERCMNVLHRGHLIPSLSLSAGANVELATSWLDSLYALIRLSLNILDTEEEAVTAAFAWLESETAPTSKGDD